MKYLKDLRELQWKYDWIWWWKILVEEEAVARQLVHKKAESTWQHSSLSHKEEAAGAVRQGKIVYGHVLQGYG